MANVLNTATLEYRESVNTADYGAGWLVNPDMSLAVGVDRKYWIIDGNAVREMTTAEKDARLAQWQAERKADLLQAVNDYGEAHYDERTEYRLKHEYNRAVNEGLVNRAALIKTALDWSLGVISDWMARDAAVNAALTHNEVMAVSLDFSNHDATDPQVTVAQALKVLD